MNYRHAFHAGNFADVVKHAVLARILVHLAREGGGLPGDRHPCGRRPLRSRRRTQASRTGEWRDGIGRLMGAQLSPDAARRCSRPISMPSRQPIGGGDLRRYPGSPLIALSLMRPQDRLVACELEPGAAAALAANLRRDARARAVAIDGWMALNAYVPPKERRGVVADRSALRGQERVRAPRRRARGGAAQMGDRGLPALVPDQGPCRPRPSGGRARARSRIGKILRAELEWPPADEPGRLSGAGLIVVNPPWRLADELGQLLPALRMRLASPSRAAGPRSIGSPAQR